MALPNPHDAEMARSLRAEQDDPWIMYIVVRDNIAWSLGRLYSLGAQSAVLCAERFRTDPAWAANFVAWDAGSFRKITLRAKGKAWERLCREHELVVIKNKQGQDLAAVLPPRLRSQRDRVLQRLQVYNRSPDLTDNPFPVDHSGWSVLRLVVPAGLSMSTGKIVAQAGHGALMCYDSVLGSDLRYQANWQRWHELELPVEVRVADPKQWEKVKAEADCVVVRDAGLTEIESGTETVITFPPLTLEQLPAALTDLPILA